MGVVRIPYITFYHRKWLAVTMSLALCLRHTSCLDYVMVCDLQQSLYLVTNYNRTSGYATMVHGRGCNPHRYTTTFTNLEITSLRCHNSETIRDRQKRRPHRLMKSSELSNGENRIALRQLL